MIKQTLIPTLTADTYADVADFKAYHNKFGNDITGIDDTTIEILLYRAFEYLETVYYDNLKGDLVEYDQKTNFPRNIDDLDVLPQRVLDAQCVLALKANSGDLLTDKEQKVKKEKVGSLEVEYSEYSNSQKQYSSIYELLKPYLLGSQSSRKVVRV